MDRKKLLFLEMPYVSELRPLDDQVRQKREPTQGQKPVKKRLDIFWKRACSNKLFSFIIVFVGIMKKNRISSKYVPRTRVPYMSSLIENTQAQSQQAHDVNITSPQRRCNVMTLHRRCIYVMCLLGYFDSNLIIMYIGSKILITF